MISEARHGGRETPGDRRSPAGSGGTDRDEEVRMWLTAIVRSSNDAIIGLALEGTITSWNLAAERLYGYTAEEAVGRPVSFLVPPEHDDEVPGLLKKVERGETVDHYETVKMARDGRRIDVSLTMSPVRGAAGDLIGASIIARDETERRWT